MLKQKAPYIMRVIYIVITCILTIVMIVVNFNPSLDRLRPHIQLPWFVSSIFLFPLALHVTHLCIPVNIKRSYFYAMLVDIIYFLAPLFLTEFIYSDDEKTTYVTFQIIKIKLFITIIFAVIYFVVYMVKKKKKVLQ